MSIYYCLRRIVTHLSGLSSCSSQRSNPLDLSFSKPISVIAHLKYNTTPKKKQKIKNFQAIFVYRIYPIHICIYVFSMPVIKTFRLNSKKKKKKKKDNSSGSNIPVMRALFKSQDNFIEMPLSSPHDARTSEDSWETA